MDVHSAVDSRDFFVFVLPQVDFRLEPGVMVFGVDTCPSDAISDPTLRGSVHRCNSQHSKLEVQAEVAHAFCGVRLAAGATHG